MINSTIPLNKKQKFCSEEKLAETYFGTFDNYIVLFTTNNSYIWHNIWQQVSPHLTHLQRKEWKKPSVSEIFWFFFAEHKLKALQQYICITEVGGWNSDSVQEEGTSKPWATKWPASSSHQLFFLVIRQTVIKKIQENSIKLAKVPKNITNLFKPAAPFEVGKGIENVNVKTFSFETASSEIYHGSVQLPDIRDRQRNYFKWWESCVHHRSHLLWLKHFWTPGSISGNQTFGKHSYAIQQWLSLDRCHQTRKMVKMSKGKMMKIQ